MVNFVPANGIKEIAITFALIMKRTLAQYFLVEARR